MSVCVCVLCVCLSSHKLVCAHARWLKCQAIRVSAVRQCVRLQQSVVSEQVSIKFYWPRQELIFSLLFLTSLPNPSCCLSLFSNTNQINTKIKELANALLIKQRSCHELPILLLLHVCAHVCWSCSPADIITPRDLGLSRLYPITLFIHARSIAHCSISPAARQVFRCSVSCATIGVGPYVSLNLLNNLSRQPFL